MTNKANQSHNKKIDPTIEFLALFNDIDKYFDRLVEQSKFIPYNEKIKHIKNSHHSLAHYVKNNEYLLKFFWEIRNHISHGIKIDGQSFTTPSKHAIGRIKHCRNIIVKPPTAIDFFKKAVQTVNHDQLCQEVFPKVLQYTHLPVYQNKNLIGIINKTMVTNRCIKNFSKIKKNEREKLSIKDIMDNPQRTHYQFIKPQTNIHDIVSHFITTKNNKNKLLALFITNDGTPDHTIQGIITPRDIALIEEHFEKKVVL